MNQTENGRRNGAEDKREETMRDWDWIFMGVLGGGIPHSMEESFASIHSDQLERG